ncbi:MAG: sigma-70 family RNA polymerase sigma factor [Proteobacteria bacterium]|nr:sigma-70 family RNA polymerase sigma factor [Pseudomonadota bacterium]
MDRSAFERRVLPHLDAGYNLARWLLRGDTQAEDAVQEAALRAMRYFDTLREGDARPWFLGIVRRTCFDALARTRQWPQALGDEDGEAHDTADSTPGPDALLYEREVGARVDAALRALPPPLREVVVLRELEGLDYAAIARIAGVPVGTVMSRLSRARERLRHALAQDLERGAA